MATEPTLRILTLDPLVLQCTACGITYDGEDRDFRSLKLLTLAFVKHLAEKHRDLLSEKFSVDAARLLRDANIPVD